MDSAAGLSNSTLQQRVTSVRLFFDFVIEQGLRKDNPVGRGRYTPGKGFAGHRDRALIPRYKKLPWIPNNAQWQTIIRSVSAESLRNRTMFFLCYDAALRREELCSLCISDFDFAYRMLNVRAEITKSRKDRVVTFSELSSTFLATYLTHRRTLSIKSGGIFISESPRNLAEPITIWTWSKVIARVAERAGIPQFTPHILRHLCLTDLARSGWDIHEIATFAGHRNIQTTLNYIHLSGRDLALKISRGMDEIHRRRLEITAETIF
jgi:site-specific recombinase XerD